MGRHNGRARRSGLQVGAALANRSRQGSQAQKGARNLGMYTTDPARPNMNSVLEQSDLGEMLAMADLSGRDFAADRGDTKVISTGETISKKDLDRAAESRKAAEERNRHRLKIPRRPAWTPDMSPEELDERQRTAFLTWRRDLAHMEEAEGLVLTPFEKNLEVWAQLWRVLERSHAVVQVVDARDPLRYWSPDMQAYAREMQPPRPSLMLLNKADLLPHSVRAAWADFLDERGIEYLFWSAKAATAALADSGSASASPADDAEEEDERTQVVGTTELLFELEELARHARSQQGEAAATEEGDKSASHPPPPRLVVGLTGFPNVGKSSTINALFGAKKTAVAPTPGKTKHFQTLNVTPALTLCDCPGLVLPTYAASKADLVAAGVIPIDRLTDVRAPAAVIAEQVSRAELQRCFNIALPAPGPGEDPHRPPTPAELLRTVALSRGWVVQGALPDEARAGRLLLHAFCSGALPHWQSPPGAPAPAGPELQHTDATQADIAHYSRPAADRAQAGPGADAEASDSAASTSTGLSSEDEDDHTGLAANGAVPAPASAHSKPAGQSLPVEDLLNEADMDLLDSLQALGAAAKPKRAMHKFQKKPVRTKGSRGQQVEDQPSDGGPLQTGRRGGLVRAGQPS